MNRQYIGARYVPKIFNNNGSSEWVEGIGYEALTIVTYLGNSYTSKVPVPANITNPASTLGKEYWVNTGNYNEQIEQYRQDTELALKTTLDVQSGNINVDSINSASMKRVTMPYVLPEWFGAKGDNTTDDSDALIQSISFASINKCAVLLRNKYYVNKSINIDVGTSIRIVGTSGNYDSLIAPTINDNYNLRIGPDGVINILGITNVSFDHVGFYGTGNTGVNIQSFRNIFMMCWFVNFDTAITITNGRNWCGENRVMYCTFSECANCLVPNAGSDGDVVGCLIHSTCTYFINGSETGGYKIENNHDYSSNGSVISGYALTVVGNYFDGFGLLTINTNGGFNITGNTFIGSKNDANLWCIKITDKSTKTVNEGCICGNTVVGDVTNATIDGLYFIDISEVDYFNSVTISGNNVQTCSALLKEGNSVVFKLDIKQAVKHLYNVPAGGFNITTNKIIFSDVCGVGYFEATGTPNQNNFVRINIPNEFAINFVEFTLKNGSVENTIIRGNTISRGDYANIASIKVTSLFARTTENDNIIGYI